MKTLSQHKPTSEQLFLISDPRPGVRLIRGAAGSGKTTTALLMLRQLSKYWLNNKKRQNLPTNIHVLVITYNRTLKGYIEELAEKQVPKFDGLDLTVSTFGKLSKDLFPECPILDYDIRDTNILQLSSKIALPHDFIVDEIDYLLGRFLPEKLDSYITCKRINRGTTPRVDKSLRVRLMKEVVYPYIEWKDEIGQVDWNDLAVKVLENKPPNEYDIIIADEAQDLSANQIRALMRCAGEPSSVIFIMDAAQRIYPRGFPLAEAGIENMRSYRLKENHRNTKEICRFAEPLLKGLDIGDDGTLPDLKSCKRHGPIPLIIKGLYNKQVNYILNYIKSNVDLSEESVAFLKPKGGAWFNEIKKALQRNSLDVVDITRQPEWPRGPANIALSTMHSAKGLEFDRIFIIGLNDQTTPHGSEEGDATLENLRRMLAVAITRARKSVIVGYKPKEASSLISLLDPDTYREESV